MKYCRDCEFYTPLAGLWGIVMPERCHFENYQPRPRNYVDGEKIVFYKNPVDNRKDESACGYDARWFEPIGKGKIQTIAELPSTTVMLDKPIPTGYEDIEPTKTPWWKLW